MDNKAVSASEVCAMGTCSNVGDIVRHKLEAMVTNGSGDIQHATVPVNPHAVDVAIGLCDPGKTSQDYYFDSYSHFGIHEEMLKDEVRTGTYRDSIVLNGHLFQDKIVMDVGCGTGILSLFAVEAGAKHVYAIECSDIIKSAREIVRVNGAADKITLIQGKLEEIELPDGVDKVDIIISEWMGYCLLYEAMMDTVLYARDKWLRPGGILMPDKCTLYICGIEDRDYKRDKIDWWCDVYGYNMSHVRAAAMMEPLVDVCQARQVCTNVFRLKEFDMYKVQVGDKTFTENFLLRAIRNDYLTAFVVYFSVEFSRCHTWTGFYTGPNDAYTHWKQTVFYLDRPLKIKKNEACDGTFHCHPGSKNKRDLDFQITAVFDGEIDKANLVQQYKMR